MSKFNSYQMQVFKAKIISEIIWQHAFGNQKTLIQILVVINNKDEVFADSVFYGPGGLL